MCARISSDWREKSGGSGECQDTSGQSSNSAGFHIIKSSDFAGFHIIKSSDFAGFHIIKSSVRDRKT